MTSSEDFTQRNEERRKTGVVRRIRRIALGLLMLLTTLAVTGLVYQAIAGSSDLGMGWSISVRPSAVGGEHDSESVVIKIFEAVGQSANLLDDQVDGFGSAVGDP